MGMPIDLFLVRHGESEANVAFEAEKIGDASMINTPEFIGQHCSKIRLTPKGQSQASRTAEWLKEHYPDSFDFLYTSEYSRALETASLLNLSREGINWRISPFLRERYWGTFERTLISDREKLHADLLEDEKNSPYYWRPPNGEALVDVIARIKLLFGTLAREWSEKQGLIVCHDEIIQSMGIELERISEHDYIQNGFPHTENCDIIHYTRMNGDKLMPHFYAKRKIVAQEAQEFIPLERREYSSKELLDMAHSTPIFFPNLTE